MTEQPSFGARNSRKITAEADAPTRKCSYCGERFTLARRRGRNSGRRTSTTNRSYHMGARYCKEACRKAASKARRRASTVAQNPEKTAERTRPLSSVTLSSAEHCFQSKNSNEKSGRGSPKNLDRRIVPDERWPGMFRIRRRDGSLTDMLNLARARGAGVMSKPRNV
jgi:hypothetical protein